MTANNATSQTSEDTENRLTLALTRAVLENLRPDRVMIPIFALVVCAMFWPWVPPARLLAWYGLVMLGLVPTLLVSRAFPKTEVDAASARKWVWTASGANVIFLLTWSSLAWLLWVPGSDFDHLLIQLVLAAGLAAHANLVGPSLHISLPSFIFYGVVMGLAPLQDGGPAYAWLAVASPFFVGYIALHARQHHSRSRAALILAEEKNNLIAALARSKKESDRARERAEKASLAKSQFLANMSHELRTPLNAIIGFSEMIETRIFRDVEKHYEYSGLIHSSGRHLLALINDILDLAKIEAGRWQLQEKELSLQAVAADTLQQLTWRAQNDHINLENGIDPRLETVYADERSIKQILLNLLSNAVKFTPENGTVRVFARRDSDGGMLVGVSDTGIGIAAEDQAKVFDSFGQGKHDVAIADKGTGLGLTIVKGLVEAHGGSVSLESEVGIGTTVTLRLPAARVMMRNHQGSQAA